MSRQRITAKLRQNHCYRECVRLLEHLGLRYTVHPPTGKGHPYILIKNPNGSEPIKMHFASTPKTFGTGNRTISDLRRKLEAAGLITRE